MGAGQAPLTWDQSTQEGRSWAVLRASALSWRVPVVPCVTLVLVLGVLAYWTTTTGLQCDELLVLRAVQLGPIDGLLAPGSSHPPLTRWLLMPVQYFAVTASPASDWLVRLPSLLAAALTIPVWWAVVRRLIPDNVTAQLLLPAMALNVCWLALGYQCAPYAWLSLFASAHALTWFWLMERPSFGTGACFVLTGVATAWSHFYGVNLLIADQLVWAVLLWRRRAVWRLWLATTAATFFAVLPLVPIALYYLRLERLYGLLEIRNFGSYFRWASDAIFCKTTLNQMRWTAPLFLLWYAAAGALVWRALRAGRTGGGADRNALPTACLIATGIFLAGFPAAQLHSLLTGKALWERYAVLGFWMHWPLLALVAYSFWGQRAARWVAACALAVTTAGFAVGNGLVPEWTFDYRPVIAHLDRHTRPGDAFFAQDVDFWQDEANFDRLWFQRYAPRPLPVITGPAMGRFQIGRDGLPLQVADQSVQRIWVYSNLLDEATLKSMRPAGWKLAELHTFGRSYPLALFVRNEGSHTSRL
ncbi:MAG: hypothetical protein OES79_02330 [Planctomycetota bacterium]|nr:hypothetical protein [Planctomycetota bacterium]